jgi:hypothetical protein
MLFLVWYDEDAKKPADGKIREAIAAYVRRFTTPPTLVLVNVADYAEVPGVRVRSERSIQPNNFWCGHEEESVVAAV